MPATLESEAKLNKSGAVGESQHTPDLLKKAAKTFGELEEAKLAAMHWAKRARYAAEDLVEDVEHGIKRHPLRWLGAAFGAGAALGMLLIVPFKSRK